MSILVQGIGMPKEGTVFVIDSTGQVWSNEWPTRGYTRLDGVTAVSVPPHGDLIDRDALEEEFEKLLVQDSLYYNALHHAPTIIPAEEGK